MTTIEIFTDIGSTEEEINDKYPLQEELTTYQKIIKYLEEHKLILIPILLTIVLIETIIYFISYKKSSINQSGGDGEVAPTEAKGGAGKKSLLSSASSPVSSTFGIVTKALGYFFRLIMLLITIILVPTIPILLYCLLAYYVIKRFVFMVTTVK